MHEKGKCTKNRFQYIKEWDVYACPNNYFLKYKTTTRQGYKEYVCDKEICSCCKFKNSCFTWKTEFRTISAMYGKNLKREI